MKNKYIDISLNFWIIFSPIIMEMFKIGDIVVTTGGPYYYNTDHVPIGTIGHVGALRKRYQGTPNAYIQYVVSFQNFKGSGDIYGVIGGFCYSDHSLKLSNSGNILNN